MASSAMEKQQQQQQQLPPPPPSQLPLKCPRCDSSNTKFCYYNNYSLSQPRHFCKACKRYWTRGGTLRNVPVGGGCRKNKRVKRTPPPAVTTSSVTATDRHQLRPVSSTLNPIFSPNNYPTSTRLSSVVDHLPAPTHHHLSSSSGLGFSSPHFLHQDHMVSSGGGGGGEVLPNNYSSSDGIRCISASSGMIMGSSTTTDTLPSMTSLLASTIQHQKFIGVGTDQNYMINNTGGGGGGGGGGGWNLLGYQNHHQMEQLGLSSTDPTPNYYWGMSNVLTAGNNWHDPAANTESSSVPSLI